MLSSLSYLLLAIQPPKVEVVEATTEEIVIILEPGIATDSISSYELLMTKSSISDFIEPVAGLSTRNNINSELPEHAFLFII